jgi:hypothetical protein
MTTSDPTSRTHARRDADDTADNQRLDALARRLHNESLDTLSARTQAQLHQRRRAALRGDLAHRPRKSWAMLAIACTAAVALAVGVQFVRPPQTVPAPTVANSTATPSPDVVVDARTAGTPPAEHTTQDSNSTSAADNVASKAQNGDAVASDPAAIGDDVVDNDGLDALLASMDAGTGADASAQAQPSDDELSDAELFASLEETPDFYLWLDSEEGEASLSEAL